MDAAGSLSGSVASAVKRGERSAIDAREGVVHKAREAHGAVGRLDVRAGRRERDDLRVHALLLEHGLPVRDVAMAAHRDVVVTGIVNARIAFGVDRDFDGAVSRLEGIQVFGRIEVVVDVNQHVEGNGRGRICERTDNRPGSRRATNSSPVRLCAGSATI